MELTKDEAYEILELVHGANFNDILKEYKFLALEWFPDKHGRNWASIKKFQLIHQAFLTLCSSEDPCKLRSLSLEEMMSLFQFIFFGSDSVNPGDESGESSVEDDEDSFDDFYINRESDIEEYLWERINISPSNESSNCGSQCHEEGSCHDITDENKASALRADEKANALIEEEEKEKRKAKKKKAQKKRRKEKKRLEKSAVKQNEVKKVKDKTESQERAYESSESEEDIDTESAFVATIAKKKNKNILLKKETEGKNTKIDDEGPSSRMLRSRQLALRGNEMANLGHFHEAIELFSEAINIEPTDHRFYGNRSYCMECLGNGERALKDAEKSLSLAPKVAKGHFRKGKALMCLKRYQEAEKCFEEVLRLDPMCDDAVKELSVAQIAQIMEMGFTKEQAETAILEGDTVVGALNLLLPTSAATKADDLFLSDDDDDFVQHCKTTTIAASPVVDAKMNPKNPEGHNSIWVGNLVHNVTENMILSLFSKYGEIMSIKFTPEKFYAFINYRNKASAGKAMQALQGLDLFGTHLLIRYPNTKPAASGKPVATSQDAGKPKIFVTPVNGDECYFWRTQGCIHGDICRFKHIKEHKGIDRKKMINKP